MDDFRIRSRKRFENEITKLFKDIMVSTLDSGEKVLQINRGDPKWKQFRFGIMNLCNDKIRMFLDRLKDYAIEFRPAIFSVEYKQETNSKSLPQTKVAMFDFSFVNGQPNFKVTLPKNEEGQQMVENLCNGLHCGLVVAKDDEVSFESWGLYEIFHIVIPFFDKNECFRGPTLERYIKWKERVYTLESTGEE